MSWSALATGLRETARRLRVDRIASAQQASVRRAIARWEAGAVVPDEQYRLLLAHIYARTPAGEVALGPGSDLAELLDAYAGYDVPQAAIDELASTVTASVTGSGGHLLAFLNPSLRGALTAALADPATLDSAVVDALGAASVAVDRQIGTVPFVRLHLAQAAITEACRHLLAGPVPASVVGPLRRVAAEAFALAARLAFETHDDGAALALYRQAVRTADPAVPERRALIRTGQTMVTYYATGDIAAARRIAEAAVADARRGQSALMRARAHALQAEIAARGEPPAERQARTALHLAYHDVDRDTSGDPMPQVFSAARLHGFMGVCGIFLGESGEAERRLSAAAAELTRPRESVQRAIVLTDRALALLRTGEPGGPETAATDLHECVTLTTATRGRVPAQRLRTARLALRPWRTEPFVAELDDHMHTAMIGLVTCPVGSPCGGSPPSLSRVRRLVPPV
ncbi:hypothetical protein Airi02_088000 [Actinoallomurus iriomotensis]|uniref:Uncharacterized protein n=2 Tax=Actinoallomurus iriomotensis TaxID=478107 RepID=A0A9W6SC25_9ACTN|nr:hypothetical protein Airi02_088000 [Actinoallomurus iriomotensis]